MSSRIAFFLASLNAGGAERVMITLANTFAATGLKVWLVVGRAEGAFCGEVAASLDMVDLGQKRAIGCVAPLARFLKEERPEILFTTLDYLNVVGIIANSLAGFPSKVVIREASTLSKKLQCSRWYVRLFLPFLMKLAYRFAHCIIAVSEGVRVDLLRCLDLPEDSVKVVYNPVNFAEICASADEKIAHKWFSERGARPAPVILAVGRFNQAKDYPVLIKAFAELLKQKDARLVILGEGECLTDIISLARSLNVEEKTDFPGFVRNPFPYMKNADLFVLSSKYEGLPNSLLQATILGCKIVSTDCQSGPREILDNGRHGILVPVGNVCALAEAMLLQLLNRGELNTFRHLEQYEARNVAEKYLDLTR